MARRDWYRKLELREDRGFVQLPAYVRGIYSMLLKYADDDGRIPLGGREPADAVGRAIVADVGERRMLKRDLPRLAEVGKIRIDADAVVVLELATERASTPPARAPLAPPESVTDGSHPPPHLDLAPPLTSISPGSRIDLNVQDHSEPDPTRRGEERRGEKGKENAREARPSSVAEEPTQTQPATKPETPRAVDPSPLPVQPALPLPGAEPTPPAERKARDVFEAYVVGWKTHTKGTRAPVLDDRRRKLIQARLRDFPVQDLIAAAGGIWLSKWHVTEGRTGFDLALRDSEHVERFRDLALEADRKRTFLPPSILPRPPGETRHDPAQPVFPPLPPGTPPVCGYEDLMKLWGEGTGGGAGPTVVRAAPTGSIELLGAARGGA